ncbi:hypothetical protein CRE_22925 [Caenorhabditis remanei]|uniref:DUF38 domain-containing protein n=1 Tax=Caenorhabditis remanei TaxID=31234 RepID=E3MW54_CAERE|nr:hypothetical protein CRE_22925 [Caenorhabditis remanei]
MPQNFSQEDLNGEVEEKPEMTMAKVFNVPGFAEQYLDIPTSEKLRIDTLEIEDDRTSGWEPPIGLRALRNTFSQVPNKLKITNLEYCVLDESEVLMETLKAIDPEHLESLQLNFQRYVYNCNPVWEDFYNLEQWKRLKTLNLQCPGLALSDIMKFFTHVENSNLEIHSFYGVNEISKHNEVMQIIEKLLQNPNLEQFIIEASYGLKSLDFADIYASLRQYDVNCDPWVDIPYPDSDKTLMMWVETNKIWFKGPCFVEEEESSDEDDDEEETEDEDEEDDRMRD